MNTNFELEDSNRKLRVWGYIRISSLEQAKNWFWKDSQLEIIKRYITYRQWEFDENLIYSDLWISWTKDEEDRPWLKQLMEDVEKGRLDVVVVWRMDRLARNTQLLLNLVDTFEYYGVRFVSNDENVETNTPTWRMFITVLWAIAQMERELIMEKTIMWKQQALEQWFFAVWWFPKFGFFRNPKTKKLEVKEEEAEIIREISELFVTQKMSAWKIATLMKWKYPKMSRWDTTRITTILSDKAYIWMYEVSKTETKYEMYIDKKTWRRRKRAVKVQRDEKDYNVLFVDNILEPQMFHEAQERLAINKRRLNNNKEHHNKPIINHLFWWLIKCDLCWSNYKWDKWKPNKAWEYKPYYRCWKQSAIKVWIENKCYNSQIRESELVWKIYHIINDILRSPNKYLAKHLKKKDYVKINEKFSKEILNNENLIDRHRKQIALLYDEYVNEADVELKNNLKEMINNFRDSVYILEERNKELNNKLQEEFDFEKAKEEIREFIDSLETNNINQLSREAQIWLLNKIIKKIIIKENSVDVYFKFKVSLKQHKNLNTKKDDNRAENSLTSAVFTLERTS